MSSQSNQRSHLIFNLFEIAQRIETEFETYLRPYTPGLYLPIKEEPIFRDDTIYCHSLTSIHPITHLPAIILKPIQFPTVLTDTVLDTKGNIVFIPKVPVDTELLLKRPQLPYRGFNLIKDYLSLVIVDGLLEWGERPRIAVEDVFKRHFLEYCFYIKEDEDIGEDILAQLDKDNRPIVALFTMEDRLRDLTRDIVSEIVEFMRNRYHDLYTVKTLHMVFSLKNNGDYRIHEHSILKHRLLDSDDEIDQ